MCNYLVFFFSLQRSPNKNFLSCLCVCYYVSSLFFQIDFKLSENSTMVALTILHCIIFNIVGVTNSLRCSTVIIIATRLNMADNKAWPRRYELSLLYLHGYSICTLKLSQLFVSFTSFGRNQFPHSYYYVKLGTKRNNRWLEWSYTHTHPHTHTQRNRVCDYFFRFDKSLLRSLSRKEQRIFSRYMVTVSIKAQFNLLKKKIRMPRTSLSFQLNNNFV